MKKPNEHRRFISTRHAEANEYSTNPDYRRHFKDGFSSGWSAHAAWVRERGQNQEKESRNAAAE